MANLIKAMEMIRDRAKKAREAASREDRASATDDLLSVLKQPYFEQLGGEIEQTTQLQDKVERVRASGQDPATVADLLDALDVYSNQRLNELLNEREGATFMSTTGTTLPECPACGALPTTFTCEGCGHRSRLDAIDAAGMTESNRPRRSASVVSLLEQTFEREAPQRHHGESVRAYAERLFGDDAA